MCFSMLTHTYKLRLWGKEGGIWLEVGIWSIYSQVKGWEKCESRDLPISSLPQFFEQASIGHSLKLTEDNHQATNKRKIF